MVNFFFSERDTTNLSRWRSQLCQQFLVIAAPIMSLKCFLCLVLLFIFVVFITAKPLSKKEKESKVSCFLQLLIPFFCPLNSFSSWRNIVFICKMSARIPSRIQSAETSQIFYFYSLKATKPTKQVSSCTADLAMLYEHFLAEIVQ